MNINGMFRAVEERMMRHSDETVFAVRRQCIARQCIARDDLKTNPYH